MLCFSSTTSSLVMIFQLLVTSLFFLSSYPCSADTNEPQGFYCDNTASGPAQSPTWTADLNTTFTSLEENVILNNGYYKAEAGTDPDKAYSLIQCRGDISKSDCTNCTGESFRLATEKCERGSSSVTISQKWCFLRYSNHRFFGKWEKSRSAILPENSSLDDRSVVAKGVAMMAGLAAAAPKEGLMFAKSEIDDGMGGKRFGLAQCSRDLKKSGCEDCLEYLLTDFGTWTSRIIDNRNWGIYGVGCFVIYGDTQFYFNTSAEQGLGVPNSANRGYPEVLATIVTILITAMAFL